ncbi:hypothetical protein Bca4012_066493 [Brassica carinata]
MHLIHLKRQSLYSSIKGKPSFFEHHPIIRNHKGSVSLAGDVRRNGRQKNLGSFRRIGRNTGRKRTRLAMSLLFTGFLRFHLSRTYQSMSARETLHVP